MNKKEIAHTALHMLTGAVLLGTCAIIIWSITNFDVLMKAYKYPEVIRQLKIDVQISK